MDEVDKEVLKAAEEQYKKRIGEKKEPKDTEEEASRRAVHKKEEDKINKEMVKKLGGEIKEEK